MKTQKLPLMPLAALVVAISLNACGKTNRESTSTDSSASAISTLPAPTYTVTSTSTSTSTNTSVVSDPPLSFSFTLSGGQNAITPAIPTDNVLKVKFSPGTTEGNAYHSASELAVDITYNSQTSTPQYTANNYIYGQVGETSQVIDLSGLIQPGAGVQILISNPRNDFYCTYAPNPFYYFDGTQYVPVNPLYNSYPGCRRSVPSTQQWSGTLLVQTSHTTAI